MNSFLWVCVHWSGIVCLSDPEQVRSGKHAPVSAKDAIRCCCRSIDAIVISCMLVVIACLMQSEYNIDLLGMLKLSFPREAELLSRLFASAWG